MKVVILCGGKGTRLSEETGLRPKPMVEIGGKPILWHIMNMYSQHGVNEFVLALGYKGDYIKEYFANYFSRNSDFTIDLSNGQIDYHKNPAKNWKITCVDTGAESMTGGRLRRLQPYLENEEHFMLTYGDGVSNVDITKLYEFHKSHGKAASVTSVRPSARFGEMAIENDLVTNFAEKPQTQVGWINGGFFVFNQEVFKHIISDETVLEKEPLEGLTHSKNLMAYKHEGFWQCMDTLRDKEYLDKLCQSGEAPWMQ